MWSNYSKTEALPRSGISALVFQSSFLGDWDHWWRREMSTLSPRGVLLGILVGVCRPTLQILTLCTSDQKMWVCTPVFRPGGSHKTPYISLLRLEHQQKVFLKSRENERIYSDTVVGLLKTILDSRPTWAESMPVFRPTRGQNPTLSFGAAHTHMAYIREYPPGFSQAALLNVIHGYWILCQNLSKKNLFILSFQVEIYDPKMFFICNVVIFSVFCSYLLTPPSFSLPKYLFSVCLSVVSTLLLNPFLKEFCFLNVYFAVFRWR